MSRPIRDLFLKGQQVLVQGNKNSYQVTKSLKQHVFQGYARETSKPVALKFDNPSSLREINAYGYDRINKSRYIRSLHETIDNGTDKCMVLEWMDTDLWSIRRGKNEHPLFPKVVAKSVLKGLSDIWQSDIKDPALHGDINPNNILVSGADTPTPTVKIADLGGVTSVNIPLETRFQGLEIRAPEIWKKPYSSPACDVWSLGVTLTHYLAGKCIFGADDMDIIIDNEDVTREETQAAWCIGKITKLVGPFTRDENDEFIAEFNIAHLLVQQLFIEIGTLEEELAKFDVPADAVQFIRHLLVVDPEKRPTVQQALDHPWLQEVQ